MSRVARSALRSAWRVQSGRIQATDTPCIVTMQKMLASAPRDDILSLAQGIVHWRPPDDALARARDAVGEPDTSKYGADDGLPALRSALARKLARRNGLTAASEVMVTAGANQAYTNLVLATLDAGDAAVLYAPYYFNHLMALQMTGAEPVALPAASDLQPDLGALRREFEARNGGGDSGRAPVRMVTLTNPGNPTGVMLRRELIEEASALCAEYGAYLVLDNTYEDFAYPGEEPHACVEAPHVVNVFSFSKAYGMMGWRVGYLVHLP